MQDDRKFLKRILSNNKRSFPKVLKKAGHIAITLLLIIATSGVTISKHYCGNALTGLSIFSSPKDCCNGPCKDCRNETKTIKVTDTFESADNQIHFHDVFKVLSDQFTLNALLPAPGYGQTDLRHISFPIKGPLMAKSSAGDSEAILQCFRL